MGAKKNDSPPAEPLLEQSGKKTIVLKQYNDLLRSTYGTEYYDRLQGPTPERAAVGLGISREALNRAIEQGTLDAWYVYDGYVPGVRKLKIISVTTESIARFKSSSRRRN